jgi:hypothetical protein
MAASWLPPLGVCQANVIKSPKEHRLVVDFALLQPPHQLNNLVRLPPPLLALACGQFQAFSFLLKTSLHSFTHSLIHSVTHSLMHARIDTEARIVVCTNGCGHDVKFTAIHAIAPWAPPHSSPPETSLVTREREREGKVGSLPARIAASLLAGIPPLAALPGAAAAAAGEDDDMLPTGAVMLFPMADSGFTLAGELVTGVLGAAATEDANLEGEDVHGSGLVGGCDGLSSSASGAFSLASLAAILAWRRFIAASSSSAAGSTSWLLAPPPPLPPLLPEDIPLRFGRRCASLLLDHSPPPPRDFPGGKFAGFGHRSPAAASGRRLFFFFVLQKS